MPSKKAFFKFVRQIVTPIILTVLFYSKANASFSEFSGSLQKNISQSQKKRFKARIQNTRNPNYGKIQTAILWQAPKFKYLAQKLNPRDEMLRELEALEILFSGAMENYPQIRKAYKISNKKKSIFNSIGIETIKQINTMTLNLDLSKFKHIESKSESQELLQRVRQYLKSNLKVYKESLFTNEQSSNSLFIKVKQAQDRLIMLCGEAAFNQARNLYTRSSI